MPKSLNLTARTGADVVSDDASGLAGVTFGSLATEGAALKVAKTVTGSPSVALMQFSVSGASVPVFEFQGNSMVSCSTILFTTGAVAGTSAIRVRLSDGVTWGWIPILPSGSVTAAAI